MDQLNALRAFCKVVEAGGFSAAADELHTTHSSISKQLRQLENLLGAQLLNRTTRKLALTEAGQTYYERARHILDDLEDADRAISHHHASPRGMLRINAPMAFGALDVASWLPRFMACYPELQVDLVCNDRYVDLIEEGFDVALRLARGLPDSTLAARKLASADTLLVAAPEYLSRHGAPLTPRDLVHHNCLQYTLAPKPDEWTFTTPDGDFLTMPVRGSLKANTGIALRAAALAGAGIAASAAFIVYQDIKQGLLVPVLPEFRMLPRELYAVYPQNRHMSPKVRAFIDFADDVYRFPAWA